MQPERELERFTKWHRVGDNENGAGVLRGYDTTNIPTELYDSNQAANSRDHFSDNRFVPPMIANGKVYARTTHSVAVFGLLYVGGDPLLSATYAPQRNVESELLGGERVGERSFGVRTRLPYAFSLSRSRRSCLTMRASSALRASS